MDKLLKNVIKSLEPLYGDTSGLVVMRELKELGISPNLSLAGKVQRKEIAEKLVDTLIISAVSPRRAAMYTSKLYRALDIGKLATLYSNIEGNKWHGRRL